MGYRDSASLRENEKILLAMHNLSLVRPERGWTSREIANNTSISQNDVLRILEDLVATGYARSFLDQNETKRFYLSGSGIIKISAFFT
jgi:DNA-binding IclR family transcriptional regulator